MEKRLMTICSKARNNRDATRIWNWIDAQPEPEPLWAVLATVCPWAFEDVTDVNSVKFSY